MNNVRCLIVDDESIAQRIIVSYLKDLTGYEIVGTCRNAMEAMDMLNEHEVDLMFLDIEMPKLKGLDFLKILNNPPAVILTTAHRNYALESYEHEILDYLLKPISFERFIQAVNRFKRAEPLDSSLKQVNRDPISKVIYIKSDRKTVKLLLADIFYIEGMNNYVIFHTENKRHVVYRSITDLLMELDQRFVRIHKSYVINKDKVESFSKEGVNLLDKEIPVGKTYRQSLEKL